jgi:hypothetical protein
MTRLPMTAAGHRIRQCVDTPQHPLAGLGRKLHVLGSHDLNLFSFMTVSISAASRRLLQLAAVFDDTQEIALLHNQEILAVNRLANLTPPSFIRSIA